MTAGDARTEQRRDAQTRQAVIASTDRSMLVEAAAGTGKTTLMIDRILSGLQRGDFRLPQTVAITFTEKAAGELESRLRRELTARHRSPELSEEERRNISRAVGELDQAHISTIHAFCAALLRERPVEAGVDPGFEVLDETQADLLKEHCWDSWISRQIHACEPPLVDALRARIAITGSPRSLSLKKLADALVAAAEVLDPSLFSVSRPRRSVEEILADLKGGAEQAATFIGEHMRRGGNVHCRALRDLAERIKATPRDDAPALRGAAYALQNIPVEKTLTSFSNDMREEAADIFDGLAAAASDMAAHLASDLLQWAGGFVAHYREEKRRRAVLDFHDLLLHAARLLRTDRAVRRHFKDRFRAFFVDEFQDTDPLQAEIIAFLCEKGRAADRAEDVELKQGKLFVVGDPKQSIYRFRGADVQVYEQFKGLFRRAGGGEESVRVVSRNFRSTPALIDGLNAVFERVFAGGEDVPEGVYQARHVPLVAAGAGPAGPAMVALCPPDRGIDELNAEAARALEARHLAGAVRDIVEGRVPPPLAGPLGEGRLTYAGFACLLRALTSVEIYEEAFEEFGIPYRVVGGRSYYQREEIGETLAVLRAVDDPLDQMAVVGALRSSYFAVSDEELFGYREAGGLWDYLRTEVRDGPVGKAMALLCEWHARRNKVPPHVLALEMLDCTKALEAFTRKPAGRQRAANMRKLVGQLRSLYRASGGTFGSIIDYLTTLHERREVEGESGAPEPGDDFVVIMSIHKAKGLEFDAVCLADLARGQPGDVGPLLIDRLDGRVELSAGRGIRSAGYNRFALREHENVLAERKRLLYVAATRARRLVVMPLYWQRGDRQSMLGLLSDTGLFASPEEVPFGQDRGGVFYWDTRARKPRPASATVSHSEQVPVAELLARRKQWQAEHDRIILRACAGPPIVIPSELVGPPAGRRHGPSGSEESRRFGSVFHEVMARLPLKATGKELEDQAGGLAAMAAAAMGLEDSAAREAADLAVGLMKNSGFRDLVGKAQVVRQEVAFAVPLERLPFSDVEPGGLLEGRIDLVLAGPDHTVVLDYKTDHVEAGRAPEAASRYWPQLALYALALDACGWLRGPAELVACFVRGPVMCTRPMDEELLAETQQCLQRAVSAPREDPATGR